MPLPQGWLTAWVKVNSKHVVYKKGEKEGDGNLNGSGPSKLNPSRSSGTIKSGATIRTATTAISEDADARAIRRLTQRKNKRRLHRTISASDLIRDMAKTEGGKPPSSEAEAVLDKSSSSQTTVDRKAAAHQPQVPPATNDQPIGSQEDRTIRSNESEGSLRFMAGFFGTDIEALDRSRLSDGSIFDSASVQVASQTHIDASSVVSRGGQSLPVHPLTSRGALHRSSESNDSPSASKGGFRFPPNPFLGDSSRGQCRRCTTFENDLTAAREDLEYLRGVAARSEYVCGSCQSEPSTHEASKLSYPSISRSKNSESLLEEVSARHKAQLEQLTKDRQRWQHEAHSKLQKYASLCKDLDEEATLRSAEAIVLHKELASLRKERDQNAGELETAKATIARSELDQEESNKSKMQLREYEHEGLDGAASAIKTRDSIIGDLSKRLEKALDLVELEREQKRHRRQIIFPSKRPTPPASQQAKEDLETELNNTKLALSEAQAAIRSLQRSSEQKEMRQIIRIENFEQHLDAARLQQQMGDSWI